MRTARMSGLLLLLAAAWHLTSVAAVGCTAEDDCLAVAGAPRCLPVTKTSDPGLPCVLDYGFNTTGFCACNSEPCVALTSANKTTRKQWLMIGDSISMGLESAAAAASPDWEITHAPSFASGSNNNDNAHWHSLCSLGWLGHDPSRWETVTINAGAHDLAFPDNEHIAVGTYAAFLRETLLALLAALKPSARIVWARITPVPTDPPPACVLIPGRLETDVAAYNAAADAVVAAIAAPALSSCDLHKVITDVCGATYASCAIAQCAGPHFTAAGFTLLGNKMAACVAAAAGRLRRCERGTTRASALRNECTTVS